MLYNRCKLKLEDALRIRSCFLALPYEIASWTSLVKFVHARGEQWSQGILWPKRTRFALDPMNKIFSGTDLEWFEKYVGPQLPTCDALGVPPATGKLASLFPGAGKKRVVC